jgi:hypothetical protein
MRTVVGFTDSDAARVTATRKQLEGRVGGLMVLVKQQLLGEAAETAWFGEDPDTAKAFSTELSDYVMKIAPGEFGDAACTYIAGLRSRLKSPVPDSAIVAAAAVVNQWLARELPNIFEDDPYGLAPALESWQKLLAIHLDLMLMKA